MAKYFKVKALVRSDTSANWTKNNPILGKGECGYATDLRRTKHGDGTTKWNSLKWDDAATVNGHEVNTDVPAGAKFTDTTYSNATASSAGLMSASDKSKLDGIGAGSNVKSVNGKTGAVTLSKADVGLGNVDNTSDLNKPISNAVRNELNSVYHIGSYYNSISNDVGHISFNNAKRSIYKIKNFYAVSGEGDYFYSAHKNPSYTITATKHFASVSELFTNNLSSDCFIRTDLCSETDPAILTIVSANEITATDVLTLLFLGHTGGDDPSRFNHWKLEILASSDSSRSFPNATITWKDGDWITVFERNNVSDAPNALYCCLNPYSRNGVNFIWIKGIRLSIYAATPRSQKNGDFGYNAVPIGGLRLLDSRPSFSPAQALGALDIAGGTVYGKTTFQEGIVGDVQGSASKVNGHTVNKDVPSDAKFTDTTYSVATASTDGLMSKTDKAKLDEISSGEDAVTIKTVKVNGTALTPDSNKAVNVTVPTLANNATTTASGMALDARMGKTLNEEIASVKTGAIDQIVNLTAAGWAGDAAPYSQSVNVTGMTSELLCELFSACAKSATVAERKAYNKAYAIVASGYAETSNGKVTFYADKKPAIDIGVRIKSISKANSVSDQTSSDISSAVDGVSNTLKDKIDSLSADLAKQETQVSSNASQISTLNYDFANHSALHVLPLSDIADAQNGFNIAFCNVAIQGKIVLCWLSFGMNSITVPTWTNFAFAKLKSGYYQAEIKPDYSVGIVQEQTSGLTGEVEVSDNTIKLNTHNVSFNSTGWCWGFIAYVLH